MKEHLRKRAAVCLAVIFAAAMELLLAGYEVSRGAGMEQREAVVIEPAELTAYVATDGGIVATGGDPVIGFQGKASWGRLELSFGEPLRTDTTMELYYSSEDQPFFDRFRRVEGYLMAGTKKAVINIPAGQWENLRISMHGYFSLEKMEAAPAVAVEQMSLGMVLSQINPVRILLFLLFGISGSLLMADKKENSTKNRLVYLDGVRTVAALFVIVVHVAEPMCLILPQGSKQYVFLTAVSLISLSCNLLFVMISGALLLPWKDESFGTFLKKRLTGVLLPFLLYSLFYIDVLCFSETDAVTWLSSAGRALYTGNIIKGPHLWLIYVILGLYLVAVPFRYMLKSMPEQLEKAVAVMILALLSVRTASVYMGMGSGISVFFGDWPGIFLMGYFLTRPWMRKYDGCWLLGGIGALGISMYLSAVRVDYKQIVTNQSILMMLMAASIFVAMIRMEQILKSVSGFLSFCSRSSYSVLLVHWYVLCSVVYRGLFSSQMPKAIQLAGPIGICILGSLLLSLLVDHFVVRVLEKIVKKACIS